MPTLTHTPLQPARRRWLAQTLGAGGALLSAPLAAQVAGRIEPLPGLRLLVPEAQQPIRLQRLDVQAEWLGRTVSTRLELLLYNPNERVLQGELQFPLAPGQSVVGFALDIDGELRPAVPVEKARGREVFEAITRRQVDPALLQQTLGPHHSLRIYPLPPRGVRRVVLQLMETLPVEPGRADLGRQTWRLPLGGELRAEQVQLELRCVGRSADEADARLGTHRLPLVDEPDGSALLRWHWRAAATSANAVVQVRLQAPKQARPLVAVQRLGEAFFAYAEVPLPAAMLAPRSWPKPRRVTLWWDASGSALTRDLPREMDFLQAWLQALARTPGPATEIQAYVLRDSAEALPLVTLDSPEGGAALLERLRAQQPDGGSRLDALPVSPGSDLAVLVSDGLATFGAPLVRLQAPADLELPVLAVVSGEDADSVGLARWVQPAGGALLDLRTLALSQAMTLAMVRPARLVQVQAEGLRDVEFASVSAEAGVVRVAACLEASEGVLHLGVQRTDGGMERIQVPVNARAARAARAQPLPLAPDLAVRQWADMRLSRLLAPLADPEADASRRAEVRALGLQHGLVTPETSLIVLETAQDYARYNITPPESLREAVRQWRARMGGATEPVAREDLAGLRRDWERRRSWWERKFPLPEEASPPPMATGMALPPPPPPAPVYAMPMPAQPAPPQAAAAAREQRARAAGAERVASPAPPGGSGASPSARIELAPFDADSEALRRLRLAQPSQRYALYLAERSAHVREPAFFLDVAEMFFADGQPGLGVRIASNLAEMNLESRTLLRVLAFRLLAADQAAAAAPVLERVLRLAPNEAQSWRDLALALARSGQAQRALDLLWRVARQTWPRAAQGVREVALAELQALLVRQPGLDARDIPDELRQPLPLALRVVLSWDGDDTDVDLAVIDPDGLRCDYQGTLTRNGGRLTADNTSGFGPEEFGLRFTKPGRYRVLARLFGERRQLLAADTLLMLSLSTDFATPQAVERQVVRRVRQVGMEIEIGQFVVD